MVENWSGHLCDTMAFVLFQHQQQCFCFAPKSTTWMSKLTTAGKARKGCLNLHRPGSHRSSLKRSLLVTGKQGKAMIGLGSD